MRAGLRAMEYIEEHDLLAHARDLGEYIRDRLRRTDASCLGDVRGKGLFIGAEFDDTDRKSGADIVSEIQTYCYRHGVIVWTAGRRGNVLRLLPPLVMTHAQAEIGLDIICSAIDEATTDLPVAR